MEDVGISWREVAFCVAATFLLLASIGAFVVAISAHRVIGRELPPKENEPVRFRPFRRKGPQ